MQMNQINTFWAAISGIGITGGGSIPIAKRMKRTNRFAISSVFFIPPSVYAIIIFN